MQPVSFLQPNHSPLIREYLSGELPLASFYQWPATLGGVLAAARARAYPEAQRAAVCDVLHEQWKQGAFGHEATARSIELLRRPDVVTVCTGHQLCLLGGPLFFIYKIASVLALARALNAAGQATVAVFWMASEDHDFEEANHLYIGSKKISWQHNESGGAVGELKLRDMDAVFAEVETELVGLQTPTDDLKWLRTCFADGQTTAQATRALVDQLFGGHGLITVDAAHPGLKAFAANDFMADAFDGVGTKALAESEVALTAARHEPQVNAREINLFYLGKGYRERIVRRANGFATADNRLAWTADELRNLIQTCPEKISPNVVLRPIYQERLLPNVAYVGGPGELAYWLQLKPLFTSIGLPMPALLHRASVTWLSPKADKRLAQLKLDIERLDPNASISFDAWVRNQPDDNRALAEFEAAVNTAFKALAANQNDANLMRSLRAEEARFGRRMHTMRLKAHRSKKQRMAENAVRIEELCDWLYPKGQPQERVHNWLMYAQQVKSLVNEMPEWLCEFDGKNRVLVA